MASADSLHGTETKEINFALKKGCVPSRKENAARQMNDSIESEKSKTPTPSPLGSFISRESDDPQELLRRRYLCREGGLLLCAPTGIGKSSFVMQCLILWALGKPAFGIVPATPLTSYLFQAENDGGDIAEMRDGIFNGLGLNASERELVSNRVSVVTEKSATGILFLKNVVEPVIKSDFRDLIVIDPALSFLGGETNSQKDVGLWLRNGINPILAEFQCGAIIVHHTNKPPTGKEKSQWQAGDFAYLGAGSAEWANWARAVLSIRSIGSHEIFELTAGKRGARIGWHDAKGTKSFSKFIAHCKEPGVIYWDEVDPEGMNQGGRPSEYSESELIALLPPEGLTSTDWKFEAAKECGIKERRFFQLIKALEKQGKTIKSKVSKKWQPIIKSA